MKLALVFDRGIELVVDLQVKLRVAISGGREERVLHATDHVFAITSSVLNEAIIKIQSRGHEHVSGGHCHCSCWGSHLYVVSI